MIIIYFSFQDVDFTTSDHSSTNPPTTTSLPINQKPQFTIVDYDQVDELIKENRQDDFNIDLTDLFVEPPIITTTEPAEIRKFGFRDISK